MRTSDPAIYAAGDCVETTDLVTGRPCFVPLGSTANKQARVAPINVCGGTDGFNELPKDKEIVAFCKVSLRGYEAAKVLQGAGFARVRVMDGGVVAWPYEKIR
jgi:NADPH-dependent 2,4-dienoyl-CoA reductase/sulfur reductase-like enzyme